jgi:ornithine cyclodeaminase
MMDAIAAAKLAYAALAQGTATLPQRVMLNASEARGCTLLMAAEVAGFGLGAKLVSVFPENRERGRPVVSALAVLLDPATGEPRALLDGTALTAWRTGAAAGAATDVLSRPDSRVAAVFGCGAQARTLVLALDAARPFDTILVYARTPSLVSRFVEDMAPQLRARLVPAPDPDTALRDADVVCTATSSSTPVFDGRRVRAGTHVNGMGSFTPSMQELDAPLVGRARVFVDSREAAREEAGDLLQAVAEGHSRPEDWTPIGEVLLGRTPGRRSPEEVTLFKSVGVAVQDVAAAVRAVDQALRLGLGRRIDL